MERFTNSLRSSVEHKDWYVALATALTLPDICGALITPGAGNKVRYSAWFNNWMAPLYGGMLSGDECFQLRCGYLHAGEANIAGGARKILDDFHFIKPPRGGAEVHNNRFNRTLQLQVDIFCLEMAGAVDEWALSVTEEEDIQQRMKELLYIHSLN